MGNEQSVRNLDKRTTRRKYGSIFKKLMATYKFPKFAESDSNLSSNIKVFVRKRPIFDHELQKKEFDVINVNNKLNLMVVHDCRLQADMKPDNAYIDSIEFHNFSGVFSEQSTNDEVYSSCVKDAVQSLKDGYNGVIFMFGQTGSGKTYTMCGLQERIANDLFEICPNGIEISMSSFEMAGNACYDLLNKKNIIQIVEGSDKNIHLKDAREVSIKSPFEMQMSFNLCLDSRTTHGTEVNSVSSRTHWVTRIFFKKDGIVLNQLTLIDLAGSERNNDSMKHDEARIKESTQINYSLMSIKNCMRIYNQNNLSNANDHIPYRMTKLSHLLKDCFTSNKTKTICIGTVSPSAKDTEHSINTLKHTSMMLFNENSIKQKRTLYSSIKKEDFNNQKMLKPVTQWTKEETINFLNTTKKGKFKNYVRCFPKQLDGKMISRFTSARFSQICGNNTVGNEMRDSIIEYNEKLKKQKLKRQAINKNIVKGTRV